MEPCLTHLWCRALKLCWSTDTAGVQSLCPHGCTYSSLYGTCAGNVSSVILMVVYLVAIHNNSVLLLAAGLPFDRALPWHKMLAFSALFNSLIHMAAFYYGGRAAGLPLADPSLDHHIYKHLTRAYGMEITGAPGARSCAVRVP